MPSSEFAEQPGTSQREAALQHGGRHVERFHRILDAQADEVAQLDDARLLRIDRLETFECLIERAAMPMKWLRSVKAAVVPARRR